MPNSIDDFLRLEDVHSLNVLDRFVALLWWHNHHHNGEAVDFNQLCEELGRAGYASINKSREIKKFAKDTRTVRKVGDGLFRLNVKAVKKLDESYLPLLENRPIPKSDTLFALESFSNTRGYINKVVTQVNVSYDHQLYDCCAVMVRRLLETLIIEVYENVGRSGELKNSDGNFQMLSGLVAHLKQDSAISIGRNSMAGLEGFKKIADSSAHNRRYNASKKDLDDKLSDVQLAVKELLALAFN